MANISHDFEVFFNDIKNSLINLWDSFNKGAASFFGSEDTARLFLTAGGAFLIIFILLKFINRD